jgi:hypothetical protein
VVVRGLQGSFDYADACALRKHLLRSG